MYTVKFSFTVFDQFTLEPWNNQYHTVFRIIFEGTQSSQVEKISRDQHETNKIY